MSTLSFRLTVADFMSLPPELRQGYIDELRHALTKNDLKMFEFWHEKAYRIEQASEAPLVLRD